MTNTGSIILKFLTIVLLALVLGVFWGTWFTLTRSLSDFSVTEFIHIGKVIIANVAFPMRILMPATIVIMLLTIWTHRDKKSSAFYLATFSWVFLMITLLITLLVLVPIDNDIKQWSATSFPEDWNAIRGRWEYFHAIRTLTAFLSFASYGLSVLIHKERRL
jgi:uncharacterized membrane protein